MSHQTAARRSVLCCAVWNKNGFRINGVYGGVGGQKAFCCGLRYGHDSLESCAVWHVVVRSLSQISKRSRHYFAGYSILQIEFRFQCRLKNQRLVSFSCQSLCKREDQQKALRRSVDFDRQVAIAGCGSFH